MLRNTLLHCHTVVIILCLIRQSEGERSEPRSLYCTWDTGSTTTCAMALFVSLCFLNLFVRKMIHDPLGTTGLNTKYLFFCCFHVLGLHACITYTYTYIHLTVSRSNFLRFHQLVWHLGQKDYLFILFKIFTVNLKLTMWTEMLFKYLTEIYCQMKGQEMLRRQNQFLN